MEILVHRLVRPLDLGAYASEHAGQQVWVWVNPSRMFRQKRVALYTELAEHLRPPVPAEGELPAPTAPPAQDDLWRVTWERSLTAWFAELWSQGPDPATHWTVEQIDALDGTDPRLVHWLTESSLALLTEFGEVKKKA